MENLKRYHFISVLIRWLRHSQRILILAFWRQKSIKKKFGLGLLGWFATCRLPSAPKLWECISTFIISRINGIFHFISLSSSSPYIRLLHLSLVVPSFLSFSHFIFLFWIGIRICFASKIFMIEKQAAVDLVVVPCLTTTVTICSSYFLGDKPQFSDLWNIIYASNVLETRSPVNN